MSRLKGRGRERRPNPRKICVVSGTRAEYGLLYWVLRAIERDRAMELQLVLTGSHLSPEFGRTRDVVAGDGFRIAAEVDMLTGDNSSTGVANSIARGVAGFAEAFRKLSPDLLLVLGDRYEVLAAAQAAMVLRIPIAHIHGGESTEGVIDEAIRHAVTKMSHLHFVSAEPHRRRVIQLGEQPSRVWNVGAPGLDNLRLLRLLSQRQLEKDLGFSLGGMFFLVTFHPVTLDQAGPEESLASLFAALSRFREATVLCTLANADAGGARINAALRQYAVAEPRRIRIVESLGQVRYLSAMRAAAAVVGNSSSGIIEAPVLGVPTVNIGDRQRGRLRAASVIDCAPRERAIARALRKALSPEFRLKARRARSLYGDGRSAPRIVRVLRSVKLDGILLKKFNDVLRR
jgi:UDP-hydrolysing UDP-N-acetyl-D-glucosamine 2-epimerase